MVLLHQNIKPKKHWINKQYYERRNQPPWIFEGRSIGKRSIDYAVWIEQSFSISKQTIRKYQ